MDTVEISKDLNDFNDNGCCLVENIISEDCRKYLVNLLALDEIEQRDYQEHQVKGSEELYNTKSLLLINQILTDKIKNCIKTENLYATYAFYRKYFENQELIKHTDRPECEISVTICLASSKEEKEWPIYLENKKQQVIYKGNTEPGCGVIYKGCELTHWREKCEHKWVKQFFSHYSTNKMLEFDNANGQRNDKILLCNLIKTITENL